MALDMASVDIADALWAVDLPQAGGARGLPSRTTQALQRAVLEGMRDFAGQAYTVDFAEITGRGGMRFAADQSSAATKCWDHLEHPQVLAVVLGFAGTRMEDPDDLLCDLKSQIPRAHANPLAAGLPDLGRVGSGWQERWQAEAMAPRANGLDLGGLLMRYAGMARDSGKTLSVSVVGHSLGAAVATLASFDIAHFLDANGARGKVSTYAFNPPRLGMEAVAQRYIAPKTAGGMAFALRQFTRSLDPIQSMPMLMHHPGWAASPRPGTYSAAGNPQVVTYQDRWADRINLSANHELPQWQPVIASAMHPSDLEHLFGAVAQQVPAPPPRPEALGT
ncbi:lipase [Acidovorax sp. SUPP2539]|nr:lipase [Acidovorax sp. SUPP2539]